jgi:hypothetical protein
MHMSCFVLVLLCRFGFGGYHLVCLKPDLLYIISGEFHFDMFMLICKYVCLCHYIGVAFPC